MVYDGWSGPSGELGARRSRRPGGVKGDPSGTCGGQGEHVKMDGDDMLTKSSEGDAGASDKVARGIGREKDLPTVRIARQSTHVNI